MAFEKLKKFVGSDIGDEKGDEYYKEDSFKEMTGSGSKMILLEPRAFSEAQQIADYLRARNAVVVNLKRVTPDKAKRIIDFLSGTLYAINGSLQKLGNGIFLCTPNNVSVEGKMSSEEKKETKDVKQDVEDYEW
ncbi:MAG: cell division protein SepF [bacterium]|nr:cell division protein SepF [bacterium]